MLRSLRESDIPLVGVCGLNCFVVFFVFCSNLNFHLREIMQKFLSWFFMKFSQVSSAVFSGHWLVFCSGFAAFLLG